MNKKLGGVIIVKVKQLRGIITNVNDEQCFLVMLRLKDFQWFDNCRCDANLHAIFHIEMIVLQISHCRHSRLDQQLYVFWWCQDWRISILVTSKCQMNLHGFFYIEVIKVTPFTATTIWFNSKEIYLYIHGNYFNHLLES
jgi:hypothetical protein